MYLLFDKQKLTQELLRHSSGSGGFYFNLNNIILLKMSPISEDSESFRIYFMYNSNADSWRIETVILDWFLQIHDLNILKRLRQNYCLFKAESESAGISLNNVWTKDSIKSKILL